MIIEVTGPIVERPSQNSVKRLTRGRGRPWRGWEANNGASTRRGASRPSCSNLQPRTGVCDTDVSRLDGDGAALMMCPAPVATQPTNRRRCDRRRRRPHWTGVTMTSRSPAGWRAEQGGQDGSVKKPSPPWTIMTLWLIRRRAIWRRRMYCLRAVRMPHHGPVNRSISTGWVWSDERKGRCGSRPGRHAGGGSRVIRPTHWAWAGDGPCGVRAPWRGRRARSARNFESTAPRHAPAGR